MLYELQVRLQQVTQKLCQDQPISQVTLDESRGQIAFENKLLFFIRLQNAIHQERGK